MMDAACGKIRLFVFPQAAVNIGEKDYESFYE